MKTSVAKPGRADDRDTDRPHSSPHAAQAARYLLGDLKSRALIVGSIDEAIRRGYLTDAQWCQVLDIFRESAETEHSRAEYQRERRAKIRGAA